MWMYGKTDAVFISLYYISNEHTNTLYTKNQNSELDKPDKRGGGNVSLVSISLSLSVAQTDISRDLAHFLKGATRKVTQRNSLNGESNTNAHTHTLYSLQNSHTHRQASPRTYTLDGALTANSKVCVLCLTLFGCVCVCVCWWRGANDLGLASWMLGRGGVSKFTLPCGEHRQVAPELGGESSLDWLKKWKRRRSNRSAKDDWWVRI